ncbi:MAG: FG-GAP repeat protein, partial [Anaerolineales bacterium]|nr:FG-GAP repeat protein [Anaerolineales bacterium]
MKYQKCYQCRLNSISHLMILLTLLLLSYLPAPLAVTAAPITPGVSPGWNQHIEPSQTPAGLSAADWLSIQAQMGSDSYLKASNTGSEDLFGRSVAVSGDTVVVGATGEASSATGVDGDQTDNSASGSGAAYVFVRSSGVWSQQAYLKASNTGANDFFGGSVAISGDTVVVGAMHEDSSATGVDGDQTNNSADASGAAYVFVRSNGDWSQQAYLKASN